MKQKLYCYVDETGQDTKGDIFIVSVVVTGKEREEIRSMLERVELSTGKKKTKWVGTKKEFKIAYLEKILANLSMRHKIFYSLSKETKAYKEITLITIASAVIASKEQEQYETFVFIDGLQKSEINKVAAGLRRIGIRTEKVRGIKDETDPLIRLADAIAGLMREYEERVGYAKRLYTLGMKNKTLINL